MHHARQRRHGLTGDAAPSTGLHDWSQQRSWFEAIDPADI